MQGTEAIPPVIAKFVSRKLTGWQRLSFAVVIIVVALVEGLAALAIQRLVGRPVAVVGALACLIWGAVAVTFQLRILRSRKHPVLKCAGTALVLLATVVASGLWVAVFLMWCGILRWCP